MCQGEGQRREQRLAAWDTYAPPTALQKVPVGPQPQETVEPPPPHLYGQALGGGGYRGGVGSLGKQTVPRNPPGEGSVGQEGRWALACGRGGGGTAPPAPILGLDAERGDQGHRLSVLTLEAPPASPQKVLGHLYSTG